MPILKIQKTSGPRRLTAVAIAAAALLLLLGTLWATIAGSQREARDNIRTTFKLRGSTSAGFVADYVDQQARRERTTGERFLSGPRVSSQRFAIVTESFGSRASVLLDALGRTIDVVPANPASIGRQTGSRYPHLQIAEGGKEAVSDLVPSAVEHEPVVGVAVAFQTPSGRRVLSIAYDATESTLTTFVEHAIAYTHNVYLLDSKGAIIAASPATKARTLVSANPSLASALARSGQGSVAGAQTPSTFTSAPVSGTPWRFVIEVPDSRLYQSVSGSTQVVPWLVLVLVSAIGALLVALFARSLSDRARLAALTQELDRTARTDSLTGLYNRRALTEQLARATAHARRRSRPLSVMMIDLDRFKQTNDRYGHEAGDEVLCALADCMRDVLRGDDLYGRWGGDEFLIALHETDEAQARTVIERLKLVAGEVTVSDIGLEHGIEMSVGCACATITTPDEIVRRADLALYEVKSRRRTRRLTSV